jgi:hypothetical protein
VLTSPTLVERLKAYWQSRPDVRQIAANTGWLLSDRVVRLVLVLLVSAWVTRYLGAEQYGYLSIAQAILALAAPLLRLGMDTLIVRLLVEGDYDRDQIMGTSFFIRLVAALVVLPAAVLITALTYPHNLIIALLTAMLGIAALAESFDVIDFWNQSQVNCAQHSNCAQPCFCYHQWAQSGGGSASNAAGGIWTAVRARYAALRIAACDSLSAERRAASRVAVGCSNGQNAAQAQRATDHQRGGSVTVHAC